MAAATVAVATVEAGMAAATVAVATVEAGMAAATVAVATEFALGPRHVTDGRRRSNLLATGLAAMAVGRRRRT